MAQKPELGSLNDKQKRFCEEYIVDLNGTQAAIRAGYSAKTAASQAERLLRNADIKEYIQSLIGKRSQRTQITADRVLQEIARLAFFDPRKMFDDSGSPLHISQLDDDTAAAIAGLDVVTKGNSEVGFADVLKVKLADKVRGLDMLGRHLKLFGADNTAADDQPVPVKVVVEVVDASKKRDADA